MMWLQHTEESMTIR